MISMIQDKSNNECYSVKRIYTQIDINGIWNKPVWNSVDSLHIQSDNNWNPSFSPKTEVKLCYNDMHLFVIFRVQDQYLKCLIEKHNGPVWQDACVEFFFTPNSDDPQDYFNIEVNCAGYAYMAYQRISRIDFDLFSTEDIKSTQIAHSIDGQVAQEIEDPMEWVIEYRLPFAMLSRYKEFQNPSKGDTWSANFFKCAENNSHPHWLSWTKITSPQPEFHLPQFMGMLKF